MIHITAIVGRALPNPKKLHCKIARKKQNPVPILHGAAVGSMRALLKKLRRKKMVCKKKQGAATKSIKTKNGGMQQGRRHAAWRLANRRKPPTALPTFQMMSQMVENLYGNGVDLFAMKCASTYPLKIAKKERADDTHNNNAQTGTARVTFQRPR